MVDTNIILQSTECPVCHAVCLESFILHDLNTPGIDEETRAAWSVMNDKAITERDERWNDVVTSFVAAHEPCLQIFVDNTNNNNTQNNPQEGTVKTPEEIAAEEAAKANTNNNTAPAAEKRDIFVRGWDGIASWCKTHPKTATFVAVGIAAITGVAIEGGTHVGEKAYNKVFTAKAETPVSMPGTRRGK